MTRCWKEVSSKAEVSQYPKNKRPESIDSGLFLTGDAGAGAGQEVLGGNDVGA